MNIDSLNLLIKLIISLIMGAVIGIERERRIRGTIFAGFRTFMLVCSLGLLSAFLYTNFNKLFPVITLSILGLLCCLNFYKKIIIKGEAGITTEIALLLTYLLGFIFYFENTPYIFSLALTFILAWILFLKEKLHEFAHKIKVKEVRDFLIFGLVFFVIYPILPPKPLDPFGILNLKFIWFALVLIFGLSFLVYVVVRLLKKEGIVVDAILGGFINAIYMSNFFSSKIKEGKIVKYAFLLTLSSLLLRIFILSSFINTAAFRSLIFLPIISIIGYTLGIISLKKFKEWKWKLRLVSPLDLKFSTIYILVFIVLYYLAHLIYIKFGKSYVYLLLPIGLVDMNTLAVTLSSLLAPNELSKFLVLVLILNIFGNLFVVYRNSKKLGRTCLFVSLFLTFLLLLSSLIINVW